MSIEQHDTQPESSEGLPPKKKVNIERLKELAAEAARLSNLEQRRVSGLSTPPTEEHREVLDRLKRDAKNIDPNSEDYCDLPKEQHPEPKWEEEELEAVILQVSSCFILTPDSPPGSGMDEDTARLREILRTLLHQSHEAGVREGKESVARKVIEAATQRWGDSPDDQIARVVRVAYSDLTTENQRKEDK